LEWIKQNKTSSFSLVVVVVVVVVITYTGFWYMEVIPNFTIH